MQPSKAFVVPNIKDVCLYSSFPSMMGETPSPYHPDSRGVDFSPMAYSGCFPLFLFMKQKIASFLPGPHMGQFRLKAFDLANAFSIA